MISDKLQFPDAGKYRIGGFAAKMIGYTIDHQLLDEKTWALFVNQFRIHSDVENDWRGEYWGKMMRGGCLTYRATGNAKLYKVLTATVNDLLGTQDELGRISTYAVENEFRGWDMWCRKYVMLGLMYYLDICKSEAFRRKIVRALCKHADYIVEHIGNGKGKKSIFDTAEVYGGLNSCSILEPFVKLYRLTGEKRYFDFATYIVNGGCCKDFNLIEICITKSLYPYQFKQVKAYEMMSCLEGVLEYYKITQEHKYLAAAVNFVDMVLETDYTIIGCSGCTHELFDHSSEKQTEPAEEVMQETCVTVTFMKLCARLFVLTKNLKYADCVERSGYNALFGAVNNENQTMEKSIAPLWVVDHVESFPHEQLPFDSYSPLFQSRRGRQIGGFKMMENGRSYGCCACIGSAGTGLFGLFGIMKDKDGYYINLYNDGKLKDDRKGKCVSVIVRADVYKKTGAVIKISGRGERFAINLRVPFWTENFSVTINGDTMSLTTDNGYFSIEREWNEDEIKVTYAAPVKMQVRNGKIAFTKGPIVLCRDERFEDITKPVAVIAEDGKTVPAKVVKNNLFDSNLTVKIATKNGEITLCDYSQAGKNFDDEHCNITVWQEVV